MNLARAYPSLGARCAQAWRDNVRALPRAILQARGLCRPMAVEGAADRLLVAAALAEAQTPSRAAANGSAARTPPSTITPAGFSKPEPLRRPLLVIDGDLLRPSLIQKPFAAATARPPAPCSASRTSFCASMRTNSPAWSSSVGTAWGRRRKATKCFPPREFEDDLIEQLNVLPEFVAACGFVNAKAPGFEADDFSPPRLLQRNVAAALHWWPAAIGIRFNSPRRALRSSIRREAAK